MTSDKYFFLGKNIQLDDYKGEIKWRVGENL